MAITAEATRAVAGTAGGAGLGTGVGAFLGHGYPVSVAIVMVCASAAVMLVASAVRWYEVRAKRSTAQVHAVAMAARARKVRDPERAMRMLIADKIAADDITLNQLLPSEPGTLE